MQFIKNLISIKWFFIYNLPKKSDSTINRVLQHRSRARKRLSTISVIVKKQLAACYTLLRYGPIGLIPVCILCTDHSVHVSDRSDPITLVTWVITVSAKII